MEGPWYYFLYLYGVFMDAFSLCEEPVKLQASELNRDQYLGRWLFIAAASSTSSSLRTFASIDSTLFSMTQSNNPERLQLQAAIRLKTGQCVPRSWIYLLKEGCADLATEGRPYMKTEFFSAKCPDSIIVQETDQDYQRILLYSRVLHPAEECIDDFKDKASCLDMGEFLLIPRTQDSCEFQDGWPSSPWDKRRVEILPGVNNGVGRTNRPSRGRTSAPLNVLAYNSLQSHDRKQQAGSTEPHREKNQNRSWDTTLSSVEEVNGQQSSADDNFILLAENPKDLLQPNPDVSSRFLSLNGKYISPKLMGTICRRSDD